MTHILVSSLYFIKDPLPKKCEGEKDVGRKPHLAPDNRHQNHGMNTVLWNDWEPGGGIMGDFMEEARLVEWDICAQYCAIYSQVT